MLGTTTRHDLGVVGQRHTVTRRQFHALGIVARHKALARAVEQPSAFATYRLGHQRAFQLSRPNHPGRMELHQLHVRQRSADAERERHTVAGVFAPTRRRTLINMNMTTGGQNHRASMDDNLLGILQLETKRTVDPPFGRQQIGDIHPFHDRNLAPINLADQPFNNGLASVIADKAGASIAMGTKIAL